MIKITEELAQNGGNCPVCGKFFKPNGVGPESCEMLSTVLNKLPSSHLLRYGANFHDWYYHIGASGGTREFADALFYVKNEEIIGKKCKWYNKFFYKMANLRNFIFVSKYGETFWNKNGCKNV